MVLLQMSMLLDEAQFISEVSDMIEILALRVRTLRTREIESHHLQTYSTC